MCGSSCSEQAFVSGTLKATVRIGCALAGVGEMGDSGGELGGSGIGGTNASGGKGGRPSSKAEDGAHAMPKSCSASITLVTDSRRSSSSTRFKQDWRDRRLITS